MTTTSCNAATINMIINMLICEGRKTFTKKDFPFDSVEESGCCTIEEWCNWKSMRNALYVHREYGWTPKAPWLLGAIKAQLGDWAI